LVLLGMVLAFFGPVLFTGRVMLFADLSFLFYPGYVFYRENVLRGVLPLWNPYTGCGEPFLADLQRGVFYPPNLIYLLLPTSLGTVISAGFHVMLAGLGAYGLSRAFRTSRTGSLLAGVLYAFNSYTITKVAFPSELGSAAWASVVLTAFVVWLRRRSCRSFLTFSVALCLQFLAGFPETLTFTIGALVLCAAFAGHSAWRARRKWPCLVTPLAGLGGAGVLAILLAMAQLLPTLETIRFSSKAMPFPSEEDTISIGLLAVFSMLIPSIYGLQAPHGAYWAPTCPDYAIGTFYIGVLPLVLFLFVPVQQVLSGRRDPQTALEPGEPAAFRGAYLATLCAVFFLYAMQRHTPFFGLCLRLVPFLKHFFSAPKCLLFVVLPLACLAGIGLDRLSLGTGQHGACCPIRRRVLFHCALWLVPVALTVFVAACLFDNAQLGRTILRRFFNLSSVPPQYAHTVRWDVLLGDSLKLSIVGLLSALLLEMYMFRAAWRKATVALIVLVSFCDLWFTNSYVLTPGPADLLESPSPYLDKLCPPGNPVRFLSYEHPFWNNVDRVFRSLAEGRNVEDLHEVKPEHVEGGVSLAGTRLARSTVYQCWAVVDKAFNACQFSNLAPRHVTDILRIVTASGVSDAIRERILKTLNCDRIVWYPGESESAAAGVPRKTRLIHLGTPLPRAYVVGGTEVLSDADAVLRRMATGPFRPLETALLERSSGGADAVPVLGGGRIPHRVTRLEYGANSLEIEVENIAEGLLVVNDTYFPGWHATVNDNEVPIYKVNYAFRGIVVPPGKNLVKMTYRPRSLRIGIAITLATLAVLIFLTAMKRTGTSEAG